MGPWAAVPGSTAGSPAPGRSRRCSPPPAPARGAPARRTPPSPSGWIKGGRGAGGGNEQPPWQRGSSSPWGRETGGRRGCSQLSPHPPSSPRCASHRGRPFEMAGGENQISLPRGSRGRVTGTAQLAVQGAGERGASGRPPGGPCGAGGAAKVQAVAGVVFLGERRRRRKSPGF